MTCAPMGLGTRPSYLGTRPKMSGAPGTMKGRFAKKRKAKMTEKVSGGVAAHWMFVVWLL